MTNDREETQEPPLFGMWLAHTHVLQERSFGYHFPLNGLGLDQYMTWNHTAAVKELGEAMDEVPSWKPWSIRHGEGLVNRDAFIGELVDTLHFVANMLVGVGCDDRELTERYWEKMRKNADRMASGTYDGVSDKCPQCHRELEIHELHSDMQKEPLKTIRVCPEHGTVA